MKSPLGKALLFLGVLAQLCCFQTFPCMAETATPPTLIDAKTEEKMEAEVKGVDLANGVSQEEARVIASAYFNNVVSGCGSISEIRDDGEFWRVSTLVGRGAQPGEDIFVEKVSGKTTSKGFPEYLPKPGKEKQPEAN